MAALAASAVAGTMLSAAPAHSATVDWTPMPGGQEALRFTGTGLDLFAPQQPRFVGNALTFTAGKGITSTTPRQFTLAPGQDVPSERPIVVGDTNTTSRLVTPRGEFTTTATPAGTMVHRISGTTSTVLTTVPGNMSLHMLLGDRLVLTGDSRVWHLNLTTLTADDVANLDTTGFSTANTYYYSLNYPSSVYWGRITANDIGSFITGNAGQTGAPGLGRMLSGRAFNSGAIAVAEHQVHGTELWLLNGTSTPQLLTNVNDDGGTAPVFLLGVRNNRMWFSVGGTVQKVYSTAGVFGDAQVEMNEPYATHEYPAAITVNGNFVATRNGVGFYSYRPGITTPELLAPGFSSSRSLTPDGKRLLFGADDVPLRWFISDGTAAGTKPLAIHTPPGHTLAGYSPDTLLAGPANAIAYQLVAQGQRQQFLQRPDRTVRLLKVTAPSTQRQTRRAIGVKVRVGAGEKVASTVTGTVKIPGAKAIRFTTQRLTTAKDRTGALTLRLPKAKRTKVLKALAKKRKVVATVKVVVRDANAGNTTTRTVTVRLR